MPISHDSHPVTDERRLRSVATRKAIINAATELFAKRGYAAASLEAITSRAGVNKALVRYHFKNKRGLYGHILSEAIAHGESLLEEARDTSSDPGSRLASFIHAITTLVRERPHFAPIVTQEWMSDGANMDTKVFERLKVFFNTHKDILEAGMATGVFRKVDPHMTHLSLVGALVFFNLSDKMRQMRREHAPSVPTMQEYADHVQQLVQQGLSPEAGPNQKG